MTRLHHTEYTTRLAAYALLVDEDQRMLLTWYNGEGVNDPCWSLPGGGIAYDETPGEAVVREVHEETGYRMEVGAPLLVDTFTAPSRLDPDRPFKSLRVVYAARVVGGELGTTEVSGTTDLARWVPLADVPHLEARAGIVDLAHAAAVGRADAGGIVPPGP